MSKKKVKQENNSFSHFILLFSKGIMMGFSSFLCSLSLTFLAPSFHLYDQLVSCFSNPKENFFKNISMLLLLGLGIFFSFGLSQFLLSDFFATYPLLLLLFMIGILAGSLLQTFSIVRTNLHSISNWVCCILFFLMAFFLSIPVLSIPTSSLSVSTALTSFGSGGLVSMAVMLPFSSVLFPDFWPKLTSLSTFFHFLLYLIGLFVGVVLISKVMEYLLQNHKMKVIFAFFGFSIAMLVATLWMLCFVQISWLQFFIGDVLAMVGYFIVIRLGGC